jgi:hypothetical protein
MPGRLRRLTERAVAAKADAPAGSPRPSWRERGEDLAGRAAGTARAFVGWVKQQLDPRPPAPVERLRLAELVLGQEGNRPGLGGYLTYEAASLGEISGPARTAGVICVASDTAPRGGDALGSQRMRELLEEASSRYSLVLIDAPPVLPWADAEALAPFVDGAVAVVRSGSTPASLARAALAGLERAGVPLTGVVLNAVDRAYLTADAEVSA